MGLSTAKEDERLLTEGDDQDRKLLGEERAVVLPQIRNRAASTKAPKGPSFVPMWNKKAMKEEKRPKIDFREPVDYLVPESGQILNFREPEVGRKIGDTNGLEFGEWSTGRSRATQVKGNPLLGVRELEISRGMNEMNPREPIVNRNEVIPKSNKPYLQELDRLFKPAKQTTARIPEDPLFPFVAVLGLIKDNVPGYGYVRENQERKEREQREIAERRVSPTLRDHERIEHPEVEIRHENPSVRRKGSANVFSTIHEESSQESSRANRRHSYVSGEITPPNLIKKALGGKPQYVGSPKRQKNPKGLTVDTNGGIAGIEHRAALKKMIRDKYPSIIKSTSGAPGRKNSIQSPTKIVLNPIEKQHSSRQPLPFKSDVSTRQNAGAGAHAGNSFSSMEQFLAPASFYDFLEPRGQVDLSRIPQDANAQWEAGDYSKFVNKSGRSKYHVSDNISLEAKEVDTSAKRLGHGRSRSGATMEQLTKGGKTDSKFAAKKDLGRGPGDIFEPL